jgi:hypothetical protein
MAGVVLPISGFGIDNQNSTPDQKLRLRPPALMHNAGSYVCHVKNRSWEFHACFFAGVVQIMGADGWQRAAWSTVDPALIRGSSRMAKVRRGAASA